MSKECNCINPNGGGTTCPPQNIALCIRGKDRQCYGECIPIPTEYNSVSENFTYWMKEKVKEKTNEHIMRNSEPYDDLKEYKETFHSLEKDNIFDSLPKGTFKYKNQLNDEISVQYTFSFEDKINPLDNEQMLQMH